jgi:hypothetical protein
VGTSARSALRPSRSLSGNDRTAESGRSFRVIAHVAYRQKALMLGRQKPASQWVINRPWTAE